MLICQGVRIYLHELMVLSHADVSSNTTQRSPVYLNKKQTNIHAITKLASQAYEFSDNP